MKKLFFLILIVFISCKKDKDPAINQKELQEKNSKEFIVENINILIDSVESFDMSKYPKFKNLKIEKFKIGLVDSIITDKNSFGAFLNFKLDKSYIAKYKADYEIKLVERDNEDVKYLFVQFSNFTFDDSIAQIVVRKRIGISMVKDKYYFERINNKWVLKKKELLSMG